MHHAKHSVLRLSRVKGRHEKTLPQPAVEGLRRAVPQLSPRHFHNLLHMHRRGIKPSEEINNSDTQKEYGEGSARHTPAGATLYHVHDVISSSSY